MTAIEKINQLSHRIFNTSVTEQNVARSSNPFAASNFQKNILTEDVFESSKKQDNKVSFTGNLTASSKRIYSTFVGSISDFGGRIAEGIETIKQFGMRMKDGFVAAWNKIDELGRTEVRLGGCIEGAKELLSKDVMTIFHSREREISKMSKMDPHTQVKPLLVDALSALEADMALVA